LRESHEAGVFVLKPDQVLSAMRTNIHRVDGVNANVYLVFDQEELTLIDTGMPRTDSSLEERMTEEIAEVKRKHSTSDLKKIPILNSYRHLLKQTLGKDESSVEALIRRVLKGRPFPSIYNVVEQPRRT
jgi:hypothetical protein